ncbi:MAG: LysM peptidoglycan-binding domain-containing protein [Candidatus Hydrogenedentes bacterium]|nr:LysM peptidoglycan-binding domain-containing protein [Candidatus Hydrogenedentota bacterium]
MTKHPDQNPEDEGQESEDERDPFEAYDDEIQRRLESDPRLESGVSPSERGSDLDFIQMSGLTAPRPADRESPEPETPASNDLDPEKPISFFEEGVADVDASMAPDVDDVPSEPDYSSEPDNRAAMEHLRDMIAELTKDEPGPPSMPEDSRQPEPAEAAAQEAAGHAEVLEEAAPGEPESPERPAPEPPIHSSQPFELTPRAEPLENIQPLEPVSMESPEKPIPTDQPFELESREEARPEGFSEKVSLDEESVKVTTEPEAFVSPEPALPEVEDVAPPPAPDVRPTPRVYTPPPMDPPASLSPEPTASPEELGDRVRIPSVEEAEEAMYLRHSAPKTRRRRSGHRKHARRRLLRIAAGLLVLAGLAVGGMEVHAWYERSVSNPVSLYNDAAMLAADGNFHEASSKYAAFAARNSEHELRAEAQFAAAFTLQQVQPASKDEQTQVYTRAIELFRQFLGDNPTHAKAPRARTLLGRLHYELGQYQEAIELLRDPELRLLDPIAAVPAVRILARSYAKLGQDDSARSYYLQAVGLPDNHTPDVDYMELGTLYRSMAERASDPEVRREYEELAVTQWSNAVQSPGIDPATKKELRAKIDVMREQGVLMEESPETPPVVNDAVDEPPAETEVPWEATAPAVDEDALDVIEDTPIVEPEPEDATEVIVEAEPDAGVEAAVVEGGELAPLDAAPEIETVYHVAAGDTLSGIATAHGTTVAELMAWNNLTESVIFVGQELVIHGPKPQEPVPSGTEGENDEENRDSTS